MYCKNASGVALDGLDAMSYHEPGGPQAGSNEFSFKWQGVDWHFANAAHRDQFAQQPEKYAPQFGGECAFAASFGGHAPGNPRSWQVQEGKLYFMANGFIRGVVGTFKGRIPAAHQKWKSPNP
jgi:YHS domain-containing protein